MTKPDEFYTVARMGRTSRRKDGSYSFRPFSIVCCVSYVVSAKNSSVGPVGPFKSTLILTDFTPNRLFLAYFEVGLQPSCNLRCTVGWTAREHLWKK